MEFIHNTTLVHLRIRAWSGEVKAKTSDITLGNGGVIPPKELLDLGRKKIFPPKALNTLKNQRAAAERACLEVGVRFMGGFAIPDHHLESVIKSLEKIEKEHAEGLIKFEREFEVNKQAWMDQNQEHSHLFYQLPSISDVRGKFSFNFSCYKLDPREGFEPSMEDVADQVLHEISVFCNQLTDRLIKRKTNTSGKSLQKLLKPVIEKLDCLSFGNGRILSVLSEFNILLDSIPDIRISKEDTVFKNVVTFLGMCGDEKRLESIINNNFSVTSLLQPDSHEFEKGVTDAVEETLTVPPLQNSALQQPSNFFF